MKYDHGNHATKAMYADGFDIFKCQVKLSTEETAREWSKKYLQNEKRGKTCE